MSMSVSIVVVVDMTISTVTDVTGTILYLFKHC